MSMTGAVNDQASAYPADGRDPVQVRDRTPPTTGRACRRRSTSVPAQHPHAGRVGVRACGQVGERGGTRSAPQTGDACPRAAPGRGTRAPPRPPTSSRAAGRGPARRRGGRPRPAARRRTARRRPHRPRSPGSHGESGSPDGEVACPFVRLVVARCQVDYAGRLTAHLPMATRVLMIKADGSVLVHSDGGSYKPLNWMTPPCTVKEGTTEDGQVEWMVDGQGRRHPADPDRGDPRTTPATTSASTRACRRTASRSTSRSCSPSTRPRWPTG